MGLELKWKPWMVVLERERERIFEVLELCGCGEESGKW